MAAAATAYLASRALSCLITPFLLIIIFLRFLNGVVWLTFLSSSCISHATNGWDNELDRGQTNRATTPTHAARRAARLAALARCWLYGNKNVGLLTTVSQWWRNDTVSGFNVRWISDWQPTDSSILRSTTPPPKKKITKMNYSCCSKW